MSDKVYVGSRCSSLEVGEPFEPISRVTFWYDDDHFYTAGDNTGRELSMENPWATQEMVNNVYNSIKGFVYKPFKATDAMIDPAAELGDGVTVGGEYFMLAQMDTTFDAKCASTIGAPGENEMDHEYPYLDPVQRELKRRVKLGQKYQGVQIDRLNGLTITETDGETQGAKVVLNSKELTFYDVGGGKVLYFDPVSKTYKFMGELNVNDKFIVDKLGNVRVSGNMVFAEESIVTWGTKGPVKYKFAVSITGPWHDTMQENDKYRRDSLDGGTTWGDPYQFVGTDGKPGANGSDADVPSYIKKTEIDATGIKTFHIKANKVEAVCPKGTQSDSETGFILTGAFENVGLRYLRIHSYADPAPYVRFSSPMGCSADWSFDRTDFSGVVDFENATVRGVTFVLA